MDHISDVSAGAAYPGLIYRTYRFYDDCMNYVDYVQKITLIDSVSPEIGIPDLTLECDPVDIATLEGFINYGGWFSDNCEIDSSSFKRYDTDRNNFV